MSPTEFRYRSIYQSEKFEHENLHATRTSSERSAGSASKREQDNVPAVIMAYISVDTDPLR